MEPWAAWAGGRSPCPWSRVGMIPNIPSCSGILRWNERQNCSGCVLFPMVVFPTLPGPKGHRCQDILCLETIPFPSGLPGCYPEYPNPKLSKPRVWDTCTQSFVNFGVKVRLQKPHSPRGTFLLLLSFFCHLFPHLLRGTAGHSSFLTLPCS